MSSSTSTDTSAAQAQRKRTLEALERRFAAAKAASAQLNNQHVRDDNNNNNRRGNTQAAAKSTFSSSACAAASPSSNASLQKDEETGPAYFKLSQPIHDNLTPTIDKARAIYLLSFSDKRGSIVDKVVHDLFQHGDSAQKYMQGSRSIKIDNYILLDNFVQGRSSSSKASFIKALKTQSKRSKKHMSIKQHKKLGTFDLPQHMIKFDNFKPMHEMWKDYIMQLVKVSGKNHLGQCFLSADLHGAKISVVECKVTSLIGVSGIMIRETTETFGIITTDDKFKGPRQTYLTYFTYFTFIFVVVSVVPKKNSVFIFQVDCWKVTLLGENLTSRNIGSSLPKITEARISHASTIQESLRRRELRKTLLGNGYGQPSPVGNHQHPSRREGGGEVGGGVPHDDPTPPAE
ncbi:hypothetical protein ACFE04_029204 [Oxalis oulophora]